MDSVPYEFIERTIVLASDPRRFRPSPFASLSGHWGRYAESYEMTEKYELIIWLRTYSDFLCFAHQRGTRVRIEELLQKKHTWLVRLEMRGTLLFNHLENVPWESMSTLAQIQELQRLLRRSNGITTVNVGTLWPRDDPEITDILEAIPRILAMNLEVEDLSSVSSIVEKHVQQRCLKAIPRILAMHLEVEDLSSVSSIVEKHTRRRCLKGLDFEEPIPRIYFPLVHQFLEKTKFLYFRGGFRAEEEDLAKETMKLIVANIKERILGLKWVYLRASSSVLEEFKKELEDVAERWPGRLSIAGTVRQVCPPVNRWQRWPLGGPRRFPAVPTPPIHIFVMLEDSCKNNK
uniref:F-box domain-containing protein n=1 Tax=Steinernema glaseri TaxID=37863 RepID=A0A1I8AGR4_9BILA